MNCLSSFLQRQRSNSAIPTTHQQRGGRDNWIKLFGNPQQDNCCKIPLWQAFGNIPPSPQSMTMFNNVCGLQNDDGTNPSAGRTTCKAAQQKGSASPGFGGGSKSCTPSPCQRSLQFQLLAEPPAVAGCLTWCAPDAAPTHWCLQSSTYTAWFTTRRWHYFQAKFN